MLDIVSVTCFNLAIEILVISGSLRQTGVSTLCQVSISQSRFLSFQVIELPTVQAESDWSFNLAIEILVISGVWEESRLCRRA